MGKNKMFISSISTTQPTSPYVNVVNDPKNPKEELYMSEYVRKEDYEKVKESLNDQAIELKLVKQDLSNEKERFERFISNLKWFAAGIAFPLLIQFLLSLKK